MSILQTLRDKVRGSLAMKQFFAYYVVPSGLFDRWFLNMQHDAHWQERIDVVLSSPDNAKISRVSDAGHIRNGKQIMHNGLKIMLGSYYGPEVSQMLVQNNGVHEPQEEYAFQVVLDELKQQGKPQYTMIELGSFWAFYSMWFKKDLPNSKNYMVEPDPFNIGCGTRNFKHNNFSGTFINAFVSDSKRQENKDLYVSVDSVMKDYAVEYFDIVHCDIQGYEADMLEGAIVAMKSQRIGYFFISTHSNDLHMQCSNILRQNNYEILASADMEETYSFDGLIVARLSSIPGPEKIDISRR